MKYFTEITAKYTDSENYRLIVRLSYNYTFSKKVGNSKNASP